MRLTLDYIFHDNTYKYVICGKWKSVGYMLALIIPYKICLACKINLLIYIDTSLLHRNMQSLVLEETNPVGKDLLYCCILCFLLNVGLIVNLGVKST